MSKTSGTVLTAAPLQKYVMIGTCNERGLRESGEEAHSILWTENFSGFKNVQNMVADGRWGVENTTQRLKIRSGYKGPALMASIQTIFGVIEKAEYRPQVHFQKQVQGTNIKGNYLLSIISDQEGERAIDQAVERRKGKRNNNGRKNVCHLAWELNDDCRGPVILELVRLPAIKGKQTPVKTLWS